MNLNTQRRDHQREATKFLRLKQITQRYQVSGSSVWNWVKAGTFPTPIKFSDNCTGWIEAETEAWAQDRISDSRKED
jgi:predicted DNA-binding transcriptional regulator AlpA